MPDQQIYGDRYFDPDDPKNQLPPKKKTKGQQLEEEGDYIDTGELDDQGQPEMITQTRQLFGTDLVDDIEERVSGFGASAYQKLIEQSQRQDLVGGTLRFGGDVISGSVENIEASKDPFNLQDEYGSSNPLINLMQIVAGYSLRGTGKALELAGAPARFVGEKAGDVAEFAGVDPRLVELPVELVSDIYIGAAAPKLLKKGVKLSAGLTQKLTNSVRAMPDLAYGLGGTGGARATSGGGLSKRMDTAYKRNKKSIKNKEGINEAAAATDTDLNAIKLAKVNKQRIRRYVEEFGGTEADVQRIMKEQILKDKNIDQSRTWLNKYFNKLTQYLDKDGKTLHEFAIKNVDGEPRLVEVATGELRRAFEKDHMKARNIFKKLADASDDPELFAGADFHENLENVYTVFNRLKSNRPPIPDEISRAIGQSTSLREFVQRRLDDSFNEGMIQIPRAFRQAAKTRMLDAVQNTIPIKGKPKKLLNRVVEEEKALWKWLTPIMEAADRAPKAIQRQLDEFANSTNPLKDYEYIKGLIERMDLDPAFVKRYKEGAENWIQMLQRSRRGGTPGGPDLSPGMFPDD